MDKYTQEMHHKDRPARGADLPQSERPGVPMEHSPRPLTPTAHWDEPPRMAPRRGIVHRKEIDQMTPVFGTGQPLHGLSGLVRRLAYSISETKARRWLLLLMADRIDVVEHGVGKLLKVAAIGTAGAAGLLLLSRTLKS
jgi:hypothetical protein